MSPARPPQPPPRSSLTWIENVLKEKNKVASVSGENFTDSREQDASTVDA